MKICKLFNALFYYFINYNFVLDVIHYISFTCGKGLLKFQIFVQNRFLIFKILKFHNFQIVSAF
jgi:hypothetical protein